MINRESSLHLKAVKIKLSFPQQIVEEHEHVRDTTHPPKHYGCIYVTRSLYEVTFPMSYRNVGSSCPHYRERRRSPHRTNSDALYAVGGGNTGPASSVTTNFTPYYLDKKHRREDTPVFPPNYSTQYLCRFCDNLYRTSSVISPRGFQKLNVPTFDCAQAETIDRSVKRPGIFLR